MNSNSITLLWQQSLALSIVAETTLTFSLPTRTFFSSGRIWVRFSQIRGYNEGVVLSMFITNETASRKIFVDDIALYGIKSASKDDGIGISVNISDALQQLLPNTQNENNMKLCMLLKSRAQLPDNTQLTIGQISVYHEQN